MEKLVRQLHQRQRSRPASDRLEAMGVPWPEFHTLLSEVREAYGDRSIRRFTVMGVRIVPLEVHSSKVPRRRPPLEHFRETPA